MQRAGVGRDAGSIELEDGTSAGHVVSLLAGTVAREDLQAGQTDARTQSFCGAHQEGTRACASTGGGEIGGSDDDCGGLVTWAGMPGVRRIGSSDRSVLRPGVAAAIWTWPTRQPFDEQ